MCFLEWNPVCFRHDRRSWRSRFFLGVYFYSQISSRSEREFHIKSLCDSDSNQTPLLRSLPPVCVWKVLMTLTFPVSQSDSIAGRPSQLTFFAGQLLADTFAEVGTTSVLETGRVHLKRFCESGEIFRIRRTEMQLFSTSISRDSW